ncbi:hypothetical protein [Flavobacterium sp. CAU 1735]|uniref:hypothetical protein n=1 Tax=Flavobacterium sp. CAU 1735 TaxID=3140361 RepID=UPI00326197EB
MENTEFNIYLKWCLDNDIKIYPIPTVVPGHYRLIISTRGIEKMGDNIYRDKPLKDEPSVWEKIRLLYRDIYKKNNNPKAA